ncbi:MAG TPA: cysteine desulfurase family protein [Candidatus Dormibacteraeota bacterium]|jgi:cysteine desulfurase|nr:cysteine desulfurase family protein [Candidatus Dormibacteraeota bacterium]
MPMVYLDHSATTPLDPEVLEAMMPYLTEEFGNASSVYGLGQRARQAIDQARDDVAAFYGVAAKEVIFTSGGTEGDNFALHGIALRNRDRGRHVITSTIEHDAVLRSAEALERDGFEITRLPVDRFGVVEPETLRQALRPDTILVSIMHANNEIGTIEPIRELVAVTREGGDAYFHTDAVQSTGKIPTAIDDLGVDLLSMSAHKLHGPKGVGCLVVRSGVRLEPQMLGGGHERNRRAGTENVAGIVGLAKAVNIARRDLEANTAHLVRLRDRLIAGVLDRIPRAELTGHPRQRLPHHASFLFEGVEGESLLLQLDMEGIAASSGSACTSGSLEPSHVILALGYPRERALGSLRLSVGKGNTDADIDVVLERLPQMVARLRLMAPISAA